MCHFEHCDPPRSYVLVTFWLRAAIYDRQAGIQTRPIANEFGAGGGDRTRTALRPRDFKSRASASSATPAHVDSVR
jgi:hypothetical protein